MGLGGHGGGDGPAEGAVAKMGPVLFWSGALAVAAITLTIGNKWIMLDFSFPLSLLLVQNTTAAVVILVSVLLKLGGAKFEKFTFQQVLIIFGSAFVSTVQLAASLIALPHVSIATLTVFSNMRALIQSAMEFCLLGERFGWKEYVVVASTRFSPLTHRLPPRPPSPPLLLFHVVCLAAGKQPIVSRGHKSLTTPPPPPPRLPWSTGLQRSASSPGAASFTAPATRRRRS